MTTLKTNITRLLNSRFKTNREQVPAFIQVNQSYSQDLEDDSSIETITIRVNTPFIKHTEVYDKILGCEDLVTPVIGALQTEIFGAFPTCNLSCKRNSNGIFHTLEFYQGSNLILQAQVIDADLALYITVINSGL